MEKLTYLVVEQNTTKSNMKGKGAITIVNAIKKKCGCRIIFSKQLEKDLQLEDYIQFGFPKGNNYIVMGKKLDNNIPKYTLKRIKKNNPNSRLVLYSKPAILEICKKMNLNFDDRTTVTFYGIEYEETENGIIAKVWEEGEKNV